MNAYAVLTAIGQDRHGLVNDISRFLYDLGLNIEDSRMAILGGEFAMLILVNGDEPALQRLFDGIEAEGQRAGLTIHARRTEGAAIRPQHNALPYEVNAYSMDHPGIVQRITRLLAERKVNIRSLDTKLSHAPHTGQPLFSLLAHVDVPATENVASLRRSLEEIGASENIDIEFKPSP